MREYFYCKAWFQAKKQATLPYSDDEARRLHEEGRPYCVLVDSAERPTHFIEVKNDFVGVGFLDADLREYLTYRFQVVEPGKLFLSMSTRRAFEGQSDAVAKETSQIFRANGSVTIRRESFSPDYALEESKSTSALKGNWEKYPAFGNYENFIREER